MIVNFQSICDQGAVRPNNEDAIKYGELNDGELIWMVIADGMGGHLAGEVASQMMVDEIEKAIAQAIDCEKNDWLCWIEIELNRANNLIYQASTSDSEKSGMGTTVVVVILYQNVAYVGWVGDSRAYLFRQSSQPMFSQITTDHSMIQMLLDKGAITEQEAETSNTKNMLSKAIGIKKGVEVETLQLKINPQDIILLSTDGLHDNIPRDSFQQLVGNIGNGFDETQNLVKKSIEGGSKDNITFGSIHIQQL